MKISKLILAGILSCAVLMTGCQKANEESVTTENGSDAVVTEDNTTETENDTVETENTLRVMTFNMKQKAGIDPKKQAEWVASFEPDVVATQEVDNNTRCSPYDVTALFQEGGNFKESFFSKQMPFQGGDYGLAMFSNYDIVDKETISIYSDEYMGDEAVREEQKKLFDEMDSADPQTSVAYDEFCQKLAEDGKRGIEPNIIQKIVIEYEGKKVSIYGVHLSYELVEVRDKQREQLAEILKEDTNEYQIVVGDFNSDQGTCEMNYFVENYNLANGKDGVWHDTFPIGDDPVMKTYSIDNIVTTKNIEIRNVVYEKTDLTDHTMVYADLVLN